MITANALGRALYAPLLDQASGHVNHARFMFLDPRARDFWVDWEESTRETAGSLRNAVARDPYDEDLCDRIAELVARSERLRQLWACRDVFVDKGGLMRIDHPIVGRVDLTYEILRIGGDSELAMLGFSAEVGSPSHDALALLATWSIPVVDDESARYRYR